MCAGCVRMGSFMGLGMLIPAAVTQVGFGETDRAVT
jgi:hypothetical protein